MSESVPSSTTGFAHRHSRADSKSSFTYFQDNEESPDWPDDEVIIDESDEDIDISKQLNKDLESGPNSPLRRKSSSYSRITTEDPLIYRHDSAKTEASGEGRAGRTSQKVYIVTEDLTIVVAGFTTRTLGYCFYITLCTITLGLAYLVLRWLPRWRVRLTGCPKPLRDCTWVVIEVRATSYQIISKVIAKLIRTNGESSPFME